MRHRKKTKTLGRKKSPREAMLKTMAAQFVLYEKITTTHSKAKLLRPFVERLITKGKKNDLNARRQLLAVLPIENATKKILEDISPRYKERAGGYTRITKLGNRQGDNAPMAKIELV